MTILYIHQYFNTPATPGGTRSYWISKELIKNGHEVIMIASSKTIEKKIEHITIDDIHVIYLKVPYSQSMGILARLKAFVSFMFKATNVALRIKAIDLVIATSTPLTIGFPALVLKKIKKIPYIFEVRDLWPEVPIQMGGLNNKLAIKIAKWFEKTIYRNATHIIALSPGMANGIVATGTPAGKVSMIPNMAKIDEFGAKEINQSLIEELNLRKETFKIIYFGALGQANAIEYILNTAELLIDNQTIEFLFIGSGPGKELIDGYIANLENANVRYLGFFNMEKTSDIVNFCDISLVTFSPIPILATNSPNKLFDSLSAGKAVIVNSNGWTKDLVEENNCGIYVNPRDPSDFKKKLLELYNSPSIIAEMGINSRRLAETVYDKSILCEKFAAVVKKVEKEI